MGTSSNDDFFSQKRPWSVHIKDRVLGSYLPLYFRKLSLRRYPIIIVDAFAGPGVFRDACTGRAEDGSPFIIYDAAVRHATASYKLLFGNKNANHHRQLAAELLARGIPTDIACAVPLQSHDLLSKLAGLITSHTVLLYLDPFGFKGCEFANLMPFLSRDPRYSTEIILNLNVADIHRLAAWKRIRETGTTEVHRRYHEVLSAVLNGDWWQSILLTDSIGRQEKERLIAKQYTDQFRRYFRYAGYCPVPERDGGQTKYYITFCSNHPDAVIAHNDNMYAAYNEYIAQTRWTGPLFEGVVDWREAMLGHEDVLDRLIQERIEYWNSREIRPTREQVWAEIISKPDYFMQWPKSKYLERVQLMKGNLLGFEAVTTSGRLNDDSPLYILKREDRAPYNLRFA